MIETHVDQDRRIGLPAADLDTPALLLDLDLLERNIERIASYCREHKVSWRPQTKGLRTPALAIRCLEAGAIGVTCAKVGDAEWLVQGGIQDILIANQVVAPAKLERLARLRRKANVAFCVDSPEGVAAAGAAAQAGGVTFDLFVEVNIGLARCGTEPGQPTVDLARTIAEIAGLRLCGLMAWEGHVLGTADPAAKESQIRAALAQLTNTADLCRVNGFPIEVVNAGGTGTYRIAATVPGVTEIQAGGGILGDRTYERWGVPMDFALTVLGTVISRPTPTRVVVDVGQRAMSVSMTVPWPKALDQVESVVLHVEHGLITLSEASETPRIGDRIEMIAGYHDTTVMLHEEIFAVRNGRIVEIWPVSPRTSSR